MIMLENIINNYVVYKNLKIFLIFKMKHNKFI